MKKRLWYINAIWTESVLLYSCLSDISIGTFKISSFIQLSCKLKKNRVRKISSLTFPVQYQLNCALFSPNLIETNLCFQNLKKKQGCTRLWFFNIVNLFICQPSNDDKTYMGRKTSRDNVSSSWGKAWKIRLSSEPPHSRPPPISSQVLGVEGVLGDWKIKEKKSMTDLTAEGVLIQEYFPRTSCVWYRHKMRWQRQKIIKYLDYLWRLSYKRKKKSKKNVVKGQEHKLHEVPRNSSFDL